VRTIITSDGSSASADVPRPPATPQQGPYGDGRSSDARALIARTAESFGSAFTVDDLASAVRRLRPSTGVATVYRAVAAMEASGFLERVGERAGTALFARCRAGGGHHHHVVCTGCGVTVATECPIGDAVTGAAAEAGFTVTGHEVRIYGLCRDCSPPPGDAAGSGRAAGRG
jgi:Fur family transcriptional regulator, ferric uptake regulator